MRTTATAYRRPKDHVTWSVSLCFRHISEPCKAALPIEMPFGKGQTRVGPRNRGLDGVNTGANWRVRWNNPRGGSSDAGYRYRYSSKLFIRQLTSPFRYTRRRTLTAAASRNGRPSSSFAGRNRAGPRPAPRRVASADDEVVRGCAPAAVRPGHRRHTATADDENGSSSSSSSDRPAGWPCLAWPGTLISVSSSCDHYCHPSSPIASIPTRQCYTEFTPPRQTRLDCRACLSTAAATTLARQTPTPSRPTAHTQRRCTSRKM